MRTKSPRLHTPISEAKPNLPAFMNWNNETEKIATAWATGSEAMRNESILLELLYSSDPEGTLRFKQRVMLIQDQIRDCEAQAKTDVNRSQLWEAGTTERDAVISSA